MMKRQARLFTTALTTAGAILMIVPCTVSEVGAAESVQYSIGEAAPANTYLAIWMAEDAGLYEAQGLDLNIVPMVGGRESAPALEAGTIQLMHIGMSSVVRANASGSDLRVIGSLSNVIRQTMFLAPGLSSAADLRGGTVGILSLIHI